MFEANYIPVTRFWQTFCINALLHLVITLKEYLSLSPDDRMEYLAPYEWEDNFYSEANFARMSDESLWTYVCLIVVGKANFVRMSAASAFTYVYFPRLHVFDFVSRSRCCMFPTLRYASVQLGLCRCS